MSKIHWLMKKPRIYPRQPKLLLCTMKLQPLHQDLVLMQGSPQQHMPNDQPTKAFSSDPHAHKTNA